MLLIIIFNRGSSLVECWVDLLECIATKADAIGQVVFVRAGLTGIPLQVTMYFISCMKLEGRVYCIVKTQTLLLYNYTAGR